MSSTGRATLWRGHRAGSCYRKWRGAGGRKETAPKAECGKTRIDLPAHAMADTLTRQRGERTSGKRNQSALMRAAGTPIAAGASRGRTSTRLLWKVLCPARSANASEVVELTL